jgi:hypothetical protein
MARTPIDSRRQGLVRSLQEQLLKAVNCKPAPTMERTTMLHRRDCILTS